MLDVHLDLVNLLEGRPLELRIYDLGGTLRRTVTTEGMAGPQQLAWDGRDKNGALVLPGAYIVRLTVAGEQSTARVVGVAY